MQVSTLDENANAGFHYLLLIDVDADEATHQLDLPAESGEYIYQFEAIAPGNYQIIAGSDSNNDLVICDSGEACAAYQTLDSPQVIEINSDIEGLDFTTGFLLTISETSGNSNSELQNTSRIYPLL